MGDIFVRSVSKVLTWLILWAGEVPCWSLVSPDPDLMDLSSMEGKYIWICEGQWSILSRSEFWTVGISVLFAIF